MSSDDGYILRKDRAQGQFVLQHYFASDDEFPPIEEATADQRFDSIERAIMRYNELDSGEDGYPSEYGLRTQL